MISARLAILHHDRSFFPLDLRQAIGADIEPIWVVDDVTTQNPVVRRLLRRLGTVVDVSGLDGDGAAEAVGAQRPEGIVSFVDDHLESAAAIAARLGLTYHSPEVAAALADKSRQRAVLEAAGVAGPRFWPLAAGDGPEQIAQLAQRVSYPAVLKPAAGSGSRGIVHLGGPEDLLAERVAHSAQVVEEYLADDPGRDQRFASYLSLESVVCAGQISHVAICGRFPLAEPFRETGNFLPAEVGTDLQHSLTELTDAAVRALGIRTGMLHTEIKLTPDGPRLIEVNGRLGGRPPFVLASVSDVNLFRVACDLALGRQVGFEGLVSCRAVGYWRMVQPPMSARRVRSVTGLDEVLAAAHVDTVSLKRQPDESVDWREGTDGTAVIVQGQVADLDELAAAIAFIDGMIQIDYDTSEPSAREPVGAGPL